MSKADATKYNKVFDEKKRTEPALRGVRLTIERRTNPKDPKRGSRLAAVHRMPFGKEFTIFIETIAKHNHNVWHTVYRAKKLIEEFDESRKSIVKNRKGKSNTRNMRNVPNVEEDNAYDDDDDDVVVVDDEEQDDEEVPLGMLNKYKKMNNNLRALAKAFHLTKEQVQVYRDDMIRTHLATA